MIVFPRRREYDLLMGGQGMRTLFIGLLLLVSSASVAKLNNNGRTPEFSKCEALANGVTSDTRNCQGEEWVRQNVRLNKVYQVALLRLTPAQQKALRVKQRAWIKYRDRSCSEIFKTEEGTIGPIIAGYCGIDTTIARINYLERYHP